MSLLDKLKKNSTIKSTQILSDSDFFNGSSLANIGIPAIDIALSGSRYGGLPAGLTIVAGPRAHFKTNLCLKMVAAYLNKYDDAVCVFLDCEFGTTPGYLKSMGVSPERVLHVPIHNIEEMKFETVAQLENIDKGDHVIFLVDSIGNMASKKELEDAKEQKSVTDMSRAKAFKSLFRMITPYLTEKNIPMLCIGHVYETQEMFSKTILSGGTGGYYSANTIIFLSKSQEKDGKELLGYNFKMIAEKSRYIREKSVIPLQVLFDGGIQKWSGLFELARGIGWIEMPSSGWYTAKNPHTGEVFIERARAKDIEDSDEFWEKLFANGFDEDIKLKYCLTPAEQAEQANSSNEDE